MQTEEYAVIGRYRKKPIVLRVVVGPQSHRHDEVPHIGGFVDFSNVSDRILEITVRDITPKLAKTQKQICEPAEEA